jgi:hypothetical protein
MPLSASLRAAAFLRSHNEYETPALWIYGQNLGHLPASVYWSAGQSALDILLSALS